ncbi:MAG: hypothetical protein ACRC5A_13475 [Enterobacteriaceae bacterium]
MRMRSIQRSPVIEVAQQHIATQSNLDELFHNNPLLSQVRDAARYLFKTLGVQADADTGIGENLTQAETIEMSHVLAKALLCTPVNADKAHMDTHCQIEGHDIHIQSGLNARVAVTLDQQYDNSLIFDVSFAEVVAKLQASSEWRTLLLQGDSVNAKQMEAQLLQKLQQSHPAGEARRMVRYLANPENVVP